jgi:hypothetical protein
VKKRPEYLFLVSVWGGMVVPKSTDLKLQRKGHENPLAEAV